MRNWVLGLDAALGVSLDVCRVMLPWEFVLVRESWAIELGLSFVV